MQVGLPKAAGNLRERLSSFVGRDAELEQLREALRCSRLVTLTVPGGAGKTRLAVEAAAALREEHRDGAWLVELASVAQAGELAPATASALEASAFAGPQPAGSTTQLIVRHLAGRSLVVVLDNCEHVIGEAAALADTLLGAVPGLRLIATSREPLGIPGEVLVPWARWPGGAPRGRITRSPMSQMWPRSRPPCADYSLSGPARQRQPPPRVVSPRSFGRRRRDPPQTTRRSPGHHLRPADLSPTSAPPQRTRATLHSCSQCVRTPATMTTRPLPGLRLTSTAAWSPQNGRLLRGTGRHNAPPARAWPLRRCGSPSTTTRLRARRRRPRRHHRNGTPSPERRANREPRR